MRSDRATFWRLSASMGASTVAQSLFGTAVPLFAVALGLTPLWLGILVALPNALPVLLAVRAGGWVDAWGARRVLWIGAAGVLSAPALLAVAPTAVALAVAQITLGVFQLLQALAAQSLVADLGGGRALERNYASFATLLSAGRLIGPPLAGVAIDVAGFQAAFALGAAAALLTVAGAWSIRRAPAGGAARGVEVGGADRAGVDRGPERVGMNRGPERRETDRGLDGQGTDRGVVTRGAGSGGAAAEPFTLRGAWGNVGVRLAVYASAGVFVAISVRQAFLPVALAEAGYPATAIGALISVGAFAAVAVRPFMPLIGRAFGGTARTLTVAMAAVAVAVGVLGVVEGFAAFAALGVLAGFGSGVGLPLSLVTVASHVPLRQRGAALGFRLSLNRLAQLIMPVVMGAVIGVAGFGVGFAVTGVALGILTVLAARRVGEFERTPPVEARVGDEGGRGG